jgi:2',3'-cyclic-nucleotide 2'-phosphodiesterase (5'-nucleotidase family)
MTQFKGKWLNTNMPDYPATSPDQMQKYDIVEMKSSDGTNIRKVALLGLMTAETVVHRKGAFGGAVNTMVPVAAAAAAAAAELDARGDIDAVVPLTHQDMEDDVALSKAGHGFPVILGGHDHDLLISHNEHDSGG